MRSHQKTEWLPKSPTLRLQLDAKIPATMRAVVYRGINDMRVETVPVPRIGPGELLIKIATCGICGTDLKKIHMGSHSAPRIFGHEMAGTIVAVGAGVTKLRSRRPRHELPSRSLRRVLLLPQEHARAVPALQENRRHRRLRALRRRLCRVHPRDGFRRRQRRRGAHSRRRALRAGRLCRAGESPCSRA